MGIREDTMAQKYVINFTDPFVDGFYVTEYTSNGTIFPISSLLNSSASGAKTSFVMYGKGK